MAIKSDLAQVSLKFLKEHQSETPSRFAEEAAWRKENAGWLRWSRQLAVTLIGYMQDNGLKRADGTDAFDTLYIGCEKFPYHDTFAINIGGVL